MDSAIAVAIWRRREEWKKYSNQFWIHILIFIHLVFLRFVCKNIPELKSFLWKNCWKVRNALWELISSHCENRRKADRWDSIFFSYSHRKFDQATSTNAQWGQNNFVIGLEFGFLLFYEELEKVCLFVCLFVWSGDWGFWPSWVLA